LKGIDPTKLSSMTKSLIRASVTLHPLLEDPPKSRGTRKDVNRIVDLGYPEQGFRRLSSAPPADLDFFRWHILAKEVPVKTLGADLYRDLKREAPDNHLHVVDVGLTQAEALEQGLLKKSDLAKMDRDIRPLPDLNFLHVPPPEIQPEAPSEVPRTEAPSSPEVSKGPSLSEAVAQTGKILESVEDSVTAPVPVCETVEAACPAPLPKVLHTYVEPRGVRIFHAKSNGAGEAGIGKKLDRLNTATLSWLHDLYTHQLKQVSFAEFEKAWNKLGGTIPENKSGGSHRTVVNSEGSIVGGIFSHGKNHTYHKGYLKYLISPFHSLGITEEALKSRLAQ
jgi:hypothetical protein